MSAEGGGDRAGVKESGGCEMTTRTIGPAGIEPDGVEDCPCCGDTSGVQAIPGTPPRVRAWNCGDCGTDWALTVVHPDLRQRYLDELAVDVAARAVLQDITDLAGHVDTLTDAQMRARLITCLARLDHACRRRGADPGAASGSPAEHRPTNGVPGAQPIPRSTAPDGQDTVFLNASGPSNAVRSRSDRAPR